MMCRVKLPPDRILTLSNNFPPSFLSTASELAVGGAGRLCLKKRGVTWFFQREVTVMVTPLWKNVYSAKLDIYYPSFKFKGLSHVPHSALCEVKV